eukprot:1156603-Pelagomonas_calceolata.AAC.9
MHSNKILPHSNRENHGGLTIARMMNEQLTTMTCTAEPPVRGFCCAASFARSFGCVWRAWQPVTTTQVAAALHNCRKLVTPESAPLKLNTAGRNGLAVLLTGHALQRQVSKTWQGPRASEYSVMGRVSYFQCLLSLGVCGFVLGSCALLNVWHMHTCVL